jgi:hypothetical protein
MAEKDAEIIIPAIDLRSMIVCIRGETPLLSNRFSERSKELIEDKQQKKARAAKPPRDPKQEFQESCHRLPNGDYAFPAGSIKKALVGAGGRFADEKMTHLRGAINVMGDLLPILSDHRPEMRSDPVRLATGVFSIAYRASFFPWEMHVPVRFNASILTEEKILYLFQVAGFSVGIGAWRPETGGTFGQFSLSGDSAAIAAE